MDPHTEIRFNMLHFQSAFINCSENIWLKIYEVKIKETYAQIWYNYMIQLNMIRFNIVQTVRKQCQFRSTFVHTLFNL